MPQHDRHAARQQMVANQILARGVRDTKVLEAMATVPRELFVPAAVASHAYEDKPLPISQGQTISQPYIVAYMVEALNVTAGTKVLEVGAGSGYAAAVLAELGAEVFAIERIEQLATLAASNLRRAGYERVHLKHADGTLGWQDEAPFDAILVSAGGTSVPQALKDQLAPKGRLVIPIGTHLSAQELVRVTRTANDDFTREDLAAVNFVPLIGEQGWPDPDSQGGSPQTDSGARSKSRSGLTRQRHADRKNPLPALLNQHAESFSDPASASLDSLVEHIGDSRIVLIGEASHGTSEFYQLRERLTRRLIEEKGFDVVAAEADWPDAARIDHYVRHRDAPAADWQAFSRFPTWMWRNVETREFVDWLHLHNMSLRDTNKVCFQGLDVYSMYTSARRVIEYLTEVDPELATMARERYACLTPWESDPGAYAQAALRSRFKSCEQDVAHVLAELLHERERLFGDNGAPEEQHFDAQQNARVVANAEAYYRVMYHGSRSAWNLRDSHMFDTLCSVLKFRAQLYDKPSKAVVWAHNSHIGDARATQMGMQGEHNLGQLCAQAFGSAAYRIGFGTHCGTVAAADEWDGPMQVKQVQPSHPDSIEQQFHQCDNSNLQLPLLNAAPKLIDELTQTRLQRAIGVIYRPQSELVSHYFSAQLANQFDHYIWLNETHATTPLTSRVLEGIPDTYPFGL